MLQKISASWEEDLLGRRSLLLGRLTLAVLLRLSSLPPDETLTAIAAVTGDTGGSLLCAVHLQGCWLQPFRPMLLRL